MRSWRAANVPEPSRPSAGFPPGTDFVVAVDAEIVSLGTAVSGRTNLVSWPNGIAVVDGAVALGVGPGVVVGAGLEVGTVNVSMTSIGRAVDAVADGASIVVG